MKGLRVTVSPASAVFFLLLLLMEGRRAVITLPSMLIHEGGHLAAAMAYGIRVKSLRLRPFGAEIGVEGAALLPDGVQMMLYGGGIIANLAAAAAIGAAMLLRYSFGGVRPGIGEPETIMLAANLGTALFNSLPVGGFDGGTVLRLLLCRRDPMKGERIMAAVSFCTVVAVWTVAGYGVLTYGSFMPLVLCFFLFERSFLRRL